MIRKLILYLLDSPVRGAYTMFMEGDKMFSIGEFSKMAKTTVKTLRHYDEIGLLAPAYVDTYSKYRFYTSNQLIIIHQIQSLRQIGLSLDEIQMIINGVDGVAILESRKKAIKESISEAEDQLSRIEFILSGNEEDTFMNYQASIKELPACTVYSKRMVVPGYDSYFELIPAIGQKVMNKYPNLKCTVPEYCFIIYRDGEYKEKDIDIEFCEAVDQVKVDFDDIKFKKMPAVKAVSIMHKGDYAGLPKAYAYAFKWIEENGYQVLDNPRESYIDGIWNKESKDEWLTELQIPVTK